MDGERRRLHFPPSLLLLLPPPPQKEEMEEGGIFHHFFLGLEDGDEKKFRNFFDYLSQILFFLFPPR